MKYLGIISHDGKNWGGSIPDLQSVWVSGVSRATTLKKLEEGLTIYLREMSSVEGEVVPPAKAQKLEEVEASFLKHFEGSTVEGVLLEPAPINGLSIGITLLFEQSGLSDAEIARRMGTTRSAMHRLQDPFYWGHSTKILRSIASVLDLKLEIIFRGSTPAPLEGV